MNMVKPGTELDAKMMGGGTGLDTGELYVTWVSFRAAALFGHGIMPESGAVGR